MQKNYKTLLMNVKVTAECINVFHVPGLEDMVPSSKNYIHLALPKFQSFQLALLLFVCLFIYFNLKL